MLKISKNNGIKLMMIRFSYRVIVNIHKATNIKDLCTKMTDISFIPTTEDHE